MQFFNTGNPQIDQLNNLGSLFGDPAKQAQAGYYGAETAKAITEAQKLRYQQQQTESLPTSLADILRTGGGAGPVPGPQPSGQPPGPPSAAAPSLNAAPALGTDGKPQPPDPNLSLGGVFHPGSVQPAGGGVMNAPPAAPNGSPAPVFDPIPYMTRLARSWLPVETQVHMAGALLNGLVQNGQMDRVTANSLLARIGTTAPYESDQSTSRQITTEGMRNATTLKQTQLQNENAVRLAAPVQTYNANDPDHPNLTPAPAVNAPGSTYQAPNTAQAAEDAKPITVLAPDGKTLIPTTMGAWRRNPAMGRPMSADEMKSITLQPEGGGPPRLAYQGPATAQGAQPYQPEQAAYDAKNITIVTPQNEVITTTNGKLKENPGLGRAYDPTVDGAVVQTVDPVTKKTVFTLTRKATAAGAQVAPKTMEEANAQAVTRAAGLTEEGSSLADTVMGSYQRAQLGLLPGQMINPDQHARVKLESDDHFQSLYPVPSGTHLGVSTLPARADQDTQALHDEITRSLETTSYKTDPAAAATKAWDMMREAGVLPDPATARKIGPGVTSLSEDPNVTEGAAPRFIVHGDMSKVGSLKWPGAGPRGAPPNFSPPTAKTLAETVAPSPSNRTPEQMYGGTKAAPPAPAPAKAAVPAPTPAPAAKGAAPAGAVGVAPAGAAEGQILRAKNGTNGVVRGGYVFPVPGSATR